MKLRPPPLLCSHLLACLSARLGCRRRRRRSPASRISLLSIYQSRPVRLLLAGRAAASMRAARRAHRSRNALGTRCSPLAARFSLLEPLRRKSATAAQQSAVSGQQPNMPAPHGRRAENSPVRRASNKLQPDAHTHRLLAGCHSIRTTTTMDMSSKQIAIGFPAAAGLRLGSARAAASWSAERRRALTFWAIFPHIRRGGGRRRSAALCSRPGAAKSGSRPCVNLKPEA